MTGARRNEGCWLGTFALFPPHSLAFPLPSANGDRFLLLDAYPRKAQCRHRLVARKGSQGPQGATPTEKQEPPGARLLYTPLCAPPTHPTRNTSPAESPCSFADNHKPASIDPAKSGTLEVNPGREATAVRVERPTANVRTTPTTHQPRATHTDASGAILFRTTKWSYSKARRSPRRNGTVCSSSTRQRRRSR